MKITTLLIIAASTMTFSATTEAKAGFSISFGNSGHRHYNSGYRSHRNYYPRYYSAPRHSGVHVSIQRGYRGYSPSRHVTYYRNDSRYDRRDYRRSDYRHSDRRYLIRYR